VGSVWGTRPGKRQANGIRTRARGSWHEGARVAFFVGTPRQFEIDFVYGVRKSHGDESMALALVLVPMGVYKVQEDHPGEGSPKAGGGYVVTVDLTATPCVISFGEDRGRERRSISKEAAHQCVSCACVSGSSAVGWRAIGLIASNK
jgi:hypothetical protein